MLPYFSIFGLTAQTYTVLLVVAVWVGLELAAHQARRVGLDGHKLHNLGFYTLLATLLGARLTYVLRHWSTYWSSPLSTFSPVPIAFFWPGGLGIGLIVAAIYLRRYQLPVGCTLDALAPGLALGLAINRLGAFLDGSSFGEPTTLPWGIYLWGVTRHPVQLYEMIALLVILAILWRQQGRRFFSGQTFTLFVALYAGVRLFIETFRANAPLLAGGIRLVQPIALVILLGVVWYLYHRHFSATGVIELEPKGRE